MTATIDIPLWMPLEAWNDFVGARNASKHPLTPPAVKLLVRQLDSFRNRGIDVAAVLNESTINGWRGVFEPKPNFQRSAHRYSPGPRGALEAMGLLGDDDDRAFPATRTIQ